MIAKRSKHVFFLNAWRKYYKHADNVLIRRLHPFCSIHVYVFCITIFFRNLHFIDLTVFIIAVLPVLNLLY